MAARQTGRKRRRRRNIKDIGKRYKGLLPKAIALIIIAGCVLLIWQKAAEFFSDSDIFDVSNIELVMRPFLREALSLDFYNIPRGMNIFELDIDTLSAQTKKRHPEFDSVVIARKPPNVVRVNIKYKQPLALLKLRPRYSFFYDKRQVLYYQKAGFVYVPISNDGTILPPDVPASGSLVVFEGVEFNGVIVKVGSACPDKRLSCGVEFLALLKKHWVINGHKVCGLDLTDTKDITLSLDSQIQVRMGEYKINTKQKIVSLKNILENPNIDFHKIKYIDLRFSNAVIGAK